MIYALGGFWLSLLLKLSAGLVPASLLLWLVGDKVPSSVRPAVGVLARLGVLGGAVIVGVGMAGTSSSLDAMQATANLVAGESAEALWSAGAMAACVPLLLGATFGAAVIRACFGTLGSLKRLREIELVEAPASGGNGLRRGRSDRGP
ncbi:MAG: hypothetical protein H6735_15405 [Alphaproteobacteria bacterium]|nr:hypothetical protein [Alphaproteobacteria bacterium]